MKYHRDHKKYKLFTKTYAIFVVALLISVATIAWIVWPHSSPTPKTDSLKASPTSSAIHTPIAAMPKSPASSSPQAQNAVQLTQARATVSAAAAQKKLTAQQAILINNELNQIQQFETTLNAPLSSVQRQSLIQHEQTWRLWAAQNHIPFAYIDVVID